MFTVSQAAKELGLSRARVHQLIKAGRLAAFRLGSILVVEGLERQIGKRGRPKGKPRCVIVNATSACGKTQTSHGKRPLDNGAGL